MFGRILKFMFTGKDNESFELIRGLTALCVIMMLVFIGFHLVVHKIFAPLEAAGGLAALLFGGGAGSAIKDGTLSKPKPAGPAATIQSADSVTVS